MVSLMKLNVIICILLWHFVQVAFFVGVQLEVSSFDDSKSLETGLVPDMKQLGAVGAVRVAIRSLQGEGLRRIRKSE